MNTFWQDLRYGVRTMMKTPGFTVVAVIAIALSIGANTTIFSTVNALLLRPFSFGNLDRLVVIHESVPQTGSTRSSVSPANFLDWQNQNQVFEQMAAYTDRSFNLTDGDVPERVEGTMVTPGFFPALDTKAALGRTFRAEEGQTGQDQVMVIKYSFWQRRFNSDPNVVGKQVNLNGQAYTIVGVMPRDFDFPQGAAQLWIPLAFDAKQQTARGSHFLRVLALTKPGVTFEQVQAEMKAITGRQEQQYPETNTGRTSNVETLARSYSRGSRQYLTVLMGAVAFVLLIACANVANLLLARGAARQKEIAVRMALGASRTRLIRQLLTESLLIALAGGALGLLLSVWGIEFISGSIPPNFTKYIPGWQKLGLDTTVFAFTLGLSVLTGLVFGLVPAFQATRTNLNESLKEGGRTTGGGMGRSRLRSVLVVSEIALSLVLLIGATLMIRSFVELMKVDPGFSATNVLTMELGLTRTRYPEEKDRINFFQRLLPRLEGLPGAQKVGAVNYLPVSGSSTSSTFKIEGRPAPPLGKEPLADYRVVTTQFFDALGIPLYKGRGFTEQDTLESPRVIIINETLARRYFAGEDPVGKRLSFSKEDKPWEVVGVAGNITEDELEDAKRPGVYVPYLQDPWWTMSLAIRTDGDPLQLTAAAQQEIRAVDKDQPVYNVRTMGQVVNERIAPKRVAMFMLGTFALIALVLASVGLYAVISYSVAQRTHEIGIRMALGAQGRDILRMVVGHGLVLTVVGLGLGLAGAFFMTRAMSQILYGVTPTDPLTYAGISFLLALIAFLATFIPARRATRVDPMIALRYE
jgi:putative ABC transport system permease protein